MQPAIIGATGIFALFALILLQVPIGFAMMTVGVIRFCAASRLVPGTFISGAGAFVVLSSTDLAAVPLFLMMGVFASMAGFSEDVYRAAAAFLGHRRGGLAYATISGSAAFGAICGSSTATAATFGKVALPQMLDRGYSPAFSTGVIAAGGTLKSLIPPSLVMIIYCVVAKTFILDMFVAAIVPALMTIAFNLIAIAVAVRYRPQVAPVSERVSWPERLIAMRRAAPSLILLLGVFVGIRSGIFTVNETRQRRPHCNLLFALARRRISWNTLVHGMYEAASVTAMLYLILMAAPIFTYFINLARVPEALVQWIQGHHFPPLGSFSPTHGSLHSAWNVLRGNVLDPNHFAAHSADRRQFGMRSIMVGRHLSHSGGDGADPSVEHVFLLQYRAENIDVHDLPRRHSVFNCRLRGADHLDFVAGHRFVAATCSALRRLRLHGRPARQSARRPRSRCVAQSTATAAAIAVRLPRSSTPTKSRSATGSPILANRTG